ncbi:MAG: hypothetical protein Q8M11_08825 [Sulfuritalea sp.]|nr:hypothetical protein [Sulfuritalea sp.]MDP1983996.1 hypothetical protein [Sulfuritalea sp.]
MTNLFRFLLTVACLLSIVGCSGGDPGPLSGTWKMGGLMPMTVKFRHGETEALGIIEKVSYEVKGNDVIVTYQDGLAKGMAMRYTVTGPNTVRTEMGVLQRIK